MQEPAPVGRRCACCGHDPFAASLYFFFVSHFLLLLPFSFKSKFGTLPRLLKKPFNSIPDADVLFDQFTKKHKSDHHKEYRAVGICATTTLLGPDPEAPPTRVFLGKAKGASAGGEQHERACDC